MTNRGVWLWICGGVGLVMLVCGLLVPAHLRAVDTNILQQAGRNTPGMLGHGLALVEGKHLGSAQLILEASQAVGLFGWDKLGAAIDASAKMHPFWLAWGTDAGIAKVLERGVPPYGRPIVEMVVRQSNRQKVIDYLGASTNLAVQELLEFRKVKNTAVFPPSDSASGQALDAAIAVTGLLLEGRHLTAGMSNDVFSLAIVACHGGNTQRFEQMLLDWLSLGQRLDWDQLVTFARPIDHAESLRLLANEVRKADRELPVIFAAASLSGQPAQVAAYLMEFSESGLRDLRESLRYGRGAVNELLKRKQALFTSNFRQEAAGYAPLRAYLNFAADLTWKVPWAGLMLKWALFLAAGFLLGAALHFAWPAVSSLEAPLQVRGFHVAREILFALGFLVVVLLVSEPFLAQESQKVEYPFRLRLPTVGSVIPAVNPGVYSSFMNRLSLLTLLLFFILQGLIYTACLVKLAEIRRQRIAPRMKLKLLENEDHLFDAGLYLGFVGTIISLILVSLGIIKPSLMAAYSSTSFGIIFVSIFKIFHLRPERRRLLMEAETVGPEPVPPSPERPLATAA